jgi:calcineurin-like phosphoesterase family protein
MRRILLVSDTHGKIDTINEKILQTKADFVIHAGDFGLFFLILYFLLDVFQYLISSILYRTLAKHYERKNENHLLKSKRDIIRPACINIPARLCFILKISFLIHAGIRCEHTFKHIFAMLLPVFFNIGEKFLR